MRSSHVGLAFVPVGTNNCKHDCSLQQQGAFSFTLNEMGTFSVSGFPPSQASVCIALVIQELLLSLVFLYCVHLYLCVCV